MCGKKSLLVIDMAPTIPHFVGVKKWLRPDWSVDKRIPITTYALTTKIYSFYCEYFVFTHNLNVNTGLDQRLQINL